MNIKLQSSNQLSTGPEYKLVITGTDNIIGIVWKRRGGWWATSVGGSFYQTRKEAVDHVVAHYERESE